VRYIPFRIASASPTAAHGWDAWANDYAALGAENRVYTLGKDLLHSLVDEIVPPPQDGRDAWVLDFNCGAGDDFARFLARHRRAVGCDGSSGMLRAAAARCARDLERGCLQLWQGRAEELEADSFDGRRFDLVFSTTGGFAYLDDDAFTRVHSVLANMLAPGGAMIIAHLTPFCAAESLFHLWSLSPRSVWKRWSGKVPIEVRGQPMQMRLRSPRKVRRLLAGVVQIERMAPLLVCTPPFQSGFRPGLHTVSLLSALESLTTRADSLAWIADQVVCVARRV
jgi:hypothetical protein